MDRARVVQTPLAHTRRTAWATTTGEGVGGGAARGQQSPRSRRKSRCIADEDRGPSKRPQGLMGRASCDLPTRVPGRANFSPRGSATHDAVTATKPRPEIETQRQARAPPAAPRPLLPFSHGLTVLVTGPERLHLADVGERIDTHQ